MSEIQFPRKGGEITLKKGIFYNVRYKRNKDGESVEDEYPELKLIERNKSGNLLFTKNGSYKSFKPSHNDAYITSIEESQFQNIENNKKDEEKESILSEILEKEKTILKNQDTILEILKTLKSDEK